MLGTTSESNLEDFTLAQLYFYSGGDVWYLICELAKRLSMLRLHLNSSRGVAGVGWLRCSKLLVVV
jgi:hypothetical protein